jgi:hypothetical protein
MPCGRMAAPRRLRARRAGPDRRHTSARAAGTDARTLIGSDLDDGVVMGQDLVAGNFKTCAGTARPAAVTWSESRCSRSRCGRDLLLASGTASPGQGAWRSTYWLMAPGTLATLPRRVAKTMSCARVVRAPLTNFRPGWSAAPRTTPDSAKNDRSTASCAATLIGYSCHCVAAAGRRPGLMCHRTDSGRRCRQLRAARLVAPSPAELTRRLSCDSARSAAAYMPTVSGAPTGRASISFDRRPCSQREHASAATAVVCGGDCAAAASRWRL